MTFFGAARRRPAFARFAVARRLCLCVTFLLLFAGLPAVQDRIWASGLRRRFTVDLFATARFLRRVGLMTILWLPGFLWRRRGFITVEPYPLITRPPPFGGLVRDRCPLRLAFSAAFWRFVPKCLICFAL